jgi:hypothetical protein
VSAAGLFCLEAVLAYLQKHNENMSLPSWLHHLGVPSWVQLAVVGMAALMLWHRIEELHGLRRKPVFAMTMSSLLQQVAAVDQIADSEDRQRRVNRFLLDVLNSFRAVFADIGKVHLNVMLPDAHEELWIEYQSPDTVLYKPDLHFHTGEGGAGVAFKTSSLVYIPRVRHRHAILISMPLMGHPLRSTRYRLRELVYKHDGPVPYRAILSAPIKGAAGTPLGVLNIDIRKTNPFSESDFQTAEVAASFLGMVLDRYGDRPAARASLPAMPGRAVPSGH